MKKSRARRFLGHVARVILRVCIAALVLWVAVSIPLPFNTQLFLMVRMPVAIFLFMIYIGKLLYDTFFYDRYQR